MQTEKDSSPSGAITVVTYNLWGIFNSKHRAARMAHFASKVGRYDVMLLQEQFSEKDFNLIINTLPSEVRESRYFRRFPSAFYGSGVAVISRFPIKSALFYTYPLQGFPERVLHGDYYANKGAALVRVNVPIGSSNKGTEVFREVLLYSTHLVAVYEKSAKLLDWRHELYLTVRLSQAVALADFICETSRPSDAIIIGGDFNATQRSLEVQVMLILLHRRGYLLRSVIPSPAAAHHTQLPSHELPLLTFSHNNVFTTTEEGWLVQGGDVPLQIDHLFFTPDTLDLCAYPDCPDAAADFPFFTPTEDGEHPMGVVVFTRPEVRLFPPQTFAQRWGQSLAAHGPCPWLRRLGQWCAQTSPKASGKAPMTCCPMSDHYGVAARLRLRETNSAERRAHADADVLLSEAEETVMRESAAFLHASVRRYRAGSRLCLLSALLSAGVVAGSAGVLCGQRRRARQHTARVLERVYALATLRSAAAITAGGQDATRGGNVWGAATRWIGRTLQWNRSPTTNGTVSPHAKPNTSTSVSAAVSPAEGVGGLEDTLDFIAIAAHVHSGSVLSAVQPLVTFVGALVSVGSLAIGVLQRAADANVLEEQVRRLRRDGF